MTETKISTAERFAKDVVNFEMEVKHDEGLYRHLRFRRPSPASSMYWFDIITWPGALTFYGDMGVWTWARISDMFKFFTRQPGKTPVNHSYWTEKLKAGEAERYEADAFRHQVSDLIEYCKTDEERAEFLEALKSDAVEYGPAPMAQDAINLQRVVDYPTATGRVLKDRQPIFSDLWEYDGKGYTYQYDWALHAVVWAIEQYEKAWDERG